MRQILSFGFLAVFLSEPTKAQFSQACPEFERFTEFVAHALGFEGGRGVVLLDPDEGIAWLRDTFGSEEIQRQASQPALRIDELLRDPEHTAVFVANGNTIVVGPRLCEDIFVLDARDRRVVFERAGADFGCSARFFAPELDGPLSLFVGGVSSASGATYERRWMIDLREVAAPIEIPNLGVHTDSGNCPLIEFVERRPHDPEALRFSYDHRGRAQLQKVFRVRVSWMPTWDSNYCAPSEGHTVLRTCTWSPDARRFDCVNHPYSRERVELPVVQPRVAGSRAAARRNRRFLRGQRPRLRSLGFR